jgi:hypothetical protein
MKVYLVWQHGQSEPSFLMGIYADKEQAREMAMAYSVPGEPQYYTVEERVVIE